MVLIYLGIKPLWTNRKIKEERLEVIQINKQNYLIIWGMEKEGEKGGKRGGRGDAEGIWKAAGEEKVGATNNI